MKKITLHSKDMVWLFCVMASLFSLSADAALPTTINHQGYLTDSGGVPISSPPNKNITFRFYNVPSGGTALWTETQSVVIKNGLFSAELGSVTPLNHSDFNNPLYLGIEVETDGEMTPRQAFSLTGYAIKAAVAEKLEGGSYDYAGYLTASNITKKTFNLLGSCGGASATAEWNYSRRIVGTDTQVERTQIRYDGTSAACRYQINRFLATPTQYEWQRQNHYDVTGTTLTSSHTYNRVIPWFISNMTPGTPWGEATDSSTSSLYTIEKVELMGLESITVPYSAYNNCLKIHRLRSRRSSTGNTFSRISWHCPGVGEVKRMHVHTDGRFASWELTGITTSP